MAIVWARSFVHWETILKLLQEVVPGAFTCPLDTVRDFDGGIAPASFDVLEIGATNAHFLRKLLLSHLESHPVSVDALAE